MNTLELLRKINILCGEDCGCDEDGHDCDNCKYCQARKFMNNLGEDLYFFVQRFGLDE
jgi:hypothetical protein